MEFLAFQRGRGEEEDQEGEEQNCCGKVSQQTEGADRHSTGCKWAISSSTTVHEIVLAQEGGLQNISCKILSCFCNVLQETDQLEDEKSVLQAEIDELLKEKERLEHVLAFHRPSCRLSESDGECDEEEDGDVATMMLQGASTSQQLLSILENGKSPESNAAGEAPTGLDGVNCIPAAAISGNCNILLCSSADDNDLEVLKGDDLDDLVPSLEMTVTSELAAPVPDIDLDGPFCFSDWETLYKSVENDLDSLSTPVMSSSPSCSNYRTVFSFNYSEIDSLAEGYASLKGSSSVSEVIKDSLNSPTLLAL